MITEQHIKAKIKDVKYIVMGRMTICQIELHSGFCVIGTSSCINPEDFNLAVGQDIAYKNAFDKLWELEGYLAMNMKPMIKLPVLVESQVKKVTRVAKYGYKVDGTPKKKPGRPRKAK